MTTKLFGTKVNRVEDQRLLRGKGRFVDDVLAGSHGGTLHAAVLRSPHAHARITDIDVDEVLDLEGVHLVWTHDDLTGPMAEPLPWCYGVARRCLANARRSSQRHDRLVARLAADPAPKVVDGLETSSGDDELHDALARLSDADRELVRLWAWEGLEPREIAVAVDSTPNAISIRLHRVRRRLADELRKDPTSAGHETSTRRAEDESEENR